MSVCSKSSPALKWSRLVYLPSGGENHFCLGDIINTWLPSNSKPISWSKKEREDRSLPVNNLSTQSMYAALSAAWNHYVPLQEVHKEAGQQFE